MPAGTLRVARKVQIGRESSPGTAVAADIKLVGNLAFNEDNQLYIPEYSRGLITPRVSASPGVGILQRKHWTGEFETDLTFEQVIPFLLMSMKGGVGPTTNTPESVKHDDNGVFSTLTNTFDNNPATSSTISGFIAAQDRILVGFSSSANKSRAIRVDMGSTVNALASTITTVEFSNGSGGWIAGTLVKDSTVQSGASMGRDGTIEWATPPSGWAEDTIDGVTSFWVRLSWSGDWTSNVTISEIYGVDIDTEWSFVPATNANPSPDTFTLEFNLSDLASQNYGMEVEHVLASDLTIRMSADDTEATKMLATMFGRQVTDAAVTTGLAEPGEFELIPPLKWKLYMDNSWAELGTTLIQGTLISFDWTFRSGLHPKYFSQGDLFMTTYGFGHREVDLRMTIEYNTTADSEREFWRNRSLRYIRLEAEGGQLADLNKIIRLDGAFVYAQDGFAAVGDRDGNDTVEVRLLSVYDAAGAQDIRVLVRNGQAQLRAS